MYHDPQREGGSGFSDTLLPATQTSGKSVSDKIRFQKRTSLLVRNKRASSGCSKPLISGPVRQWCLARAAEAVRCS